MRRETHGHSLLTQEIFCIYADPLPSQETETEEFENPQNPAHVFFGMKFPIWFCLGGGGALLALLRMIVR